MLGADQKCDREPESREQNRESNPKAAGRSRLPVSGRRRSERRRVRKPQREAIVVLLGAHPGELRPRGDCDRRVGGENDDGPVAFDFAP